MPPRISQKQLKTRRKLGKIFVDLNKLFTIKEISQKFKIPEWKIQRLKKYRKVKLPEPKKISKVYRFYNQLLKRKRKEDLLHHYTVEKGRIKPIKRLGRKQLQKLIKEYDIEGTTEKLGVSTLTIKRWEKELPKRMKLEYRERLFKEFKEITEAKAGIFFLQKLRGEKPLYAFIIYTHYFNGTEEEFEFYISTKVWGPIMILDSLIASPKHFDFEEAKEFLKHLEEVDRAHFRSSRKACKEFIEENFTGRKKQKLLAELKKYA
jgi:hypothetical protein